MNIHWFLCRIRFRSGCSCTEQRKRFLIFKFWSSTLLHPPPSPRILLDSFCFYIKLYIDMLAVYDIVERTQLEKWKIVFPWEYWKFMIPWQRILKRVANLLTERATGRCCAITFKCTFYLDGMNNRWQEHNLNNE